MPSVILAQPVASGPQPVISGFPWSGRANIPTGGVQLRLHPNASGNCYIYLSGGPRLSGAVQINSGGMWMSGGGLNDGMIMAPGDSYFIPRSFTGLSGNISIYVYHDPAVSGQGRIYWEVM